MKQTADKQRKQQTTSAKPSKPACGTLIHIAECRGSFWKPGSIRWQGAADTTNRTVRKYRVDG